MVTEDVKLDERYHSLMVDPGGCTIRFGAIGTGISEMRTVVGHPRYSQVVDEEIRHNPSQFYFGKDALDHRGVLHLDYPIENGAITKWTAFRQLLGNIMNKIEHADRILIGLKNHFESKHMKKLSRIITDELGASEFAFKHQAVLALYAMERPTGVVVDTGLNSTLIVPIVKGNIVTKAIRDIAIGGRQLTDFLRRRLHEKGYRFEKGIEQDIVRNIKESVCKFPIEDFIEADDSYYVLPSGLTLKLQNEIFETPILFFRPEMYEESIKPLHNQILEAITSCDAVDREDLLGNIILTGGSSKFPGFTERLTKELVGKSKSNEAVRVNSHKNRQHTVFEGGIKWIQDNPESSSWKSVFQNDVLESSYHFF
ncbi:MAG: hypothetical protein GF411_09455 [Candidatus Lokiarchaeota archaeon]|nr:hypothetical protein [Candidatus Lokiarchaeota archaeon]